MLTHPHTRWDGTYRLNDVFNGYPVARRHRGLRNVRLFRWMLSITANRPWTLKVNGGADYFDPLGFTPHLEESTPAHISLVGDAKFPTTDIPQVKAELRTWYEAGETIYLRGDEEILLNQRENYNNDESYINEMLDTCFDWDEQRPSKLEYLTQLQIARHIGITVKSVIHIDHPKLRKLLYKRVNKTRHRYIYSERTTYRHYLMPPRIYDKSV